MTNIAIVTGGGGGLGRELALGLAGAGHGVVVADVDEAAASQTADQIRGYGVPARSVPADLSDPAAAQRVLTVAQDLGGPHVLVNNAGGWTSSWASTLTLNLTVPMLLTQSCLEPMRALGGGAVVNIASSAALGAEPYAAPDYGAAKAGLIRFTTAMGAEPGVRVMCVVPDWIGLPRAHDEWSRLSPAEQAATRPLIPPGDIVAVVLDLIAAGKPGTVVEMS
jgi:NAD(P)-dependent dehydrogenase (short-subunit alcohol dehydrogenase family)